MNRETNRDIYNRTMNNCKFYEKENQALKLLNEIGVLRGISYCLENEGDTFFTMIMISCISLIFRMNYL